jgi:hypothetical protein
MLRRRLAVLLPAVMLVEMAPSLALGEAAHFDRGKHTPKGSGTLNKIPTSAVATLAVGPSNG